MKRKTRKSLNRRVKVTKTGKIIHRTQNMRHHRNRKSSSQVRRMKTVKFLTGGTGRRIKKALGV